MAAINNEEAKKNQFEKSMYDRKLLMQYSWIYKVLSENASYIGTKTNMANVIIWDLVTVLSLILSASSANYPNELCKILAVIFCIGVLIYSIIWNISWFSNRKSITDILFELNKNNELDKNNQPKKK